MSSFYHFTRRAVEDVPPVMDDSEGFAPKRTSIRFNEEIDAALLNEGVDMRELASELDCDVDDLMNRWFKLKKPVRGQDETLLPSQKRKILVKSYKKRAPRAVRKPFPNAIRDKSQKEQLAQAIAMKKDRQELSQEKIVTPDFSKARTVRVDAKTTIYANAGETDQQAIDKYERNRRNRVQRASWFANRLS